MCDEGTQVWPCSRLVPLVLVVGSFSVSRSWFAGRKAGRVLEHPPPPPPAERCYLCPPQQFSSFPVPLQALKRV